MKKNKLKYCFENIVLRPEIEKKRIGKQVIDIKTRVNKPQVIDIISMQMMFGCQEMSHTLLKRQQVSPT